MSATRRTLITAAGAALASGQVARAAGAVRGDLGAEAGSAAAELFARSGEANAALMRGDVGRYRDLVAYADDFTLMSPFGGTPSRAAGFSEERWEEIGQFFRHGDFKQELIEAYASDDLVVLALIERTHVEVGGLPAQDWSLRVTLVYRRVGGEWLLAHRHADPLAPGVTVEQAAALARGEAARPD